MDIRKLDELKLYIHGCIKESNDKYIKIILMNIADKLTEIQEENFPKENEEEKRKASENMFKKVMSSIKQNNNEG